MRCGITELRRLAPHNGPTISLRGFDHVSTAATQTTRASRYACGSEQAVEAGRAACVEPERLRNASETGLLKVMEYLQDEDCDVRVQTPLAADLAAIREGAKPSTLLQPPLTPHRPVDPPLVECIKARLAAYIEYLQKGGMSRKDAAEWVLPGRISALFAKELLRTVKVVLIIFQRTVPAIRDFLRQLVAFATSGDVAASRLVIQLAQEVDRQVHTARTGQFTVVISTKG